MQPVVSQASVKTILIAYNESGRRIGETHHNSRIPDSMVEHMRDLHEYQGHTHKQISERLQMSLRTVEKICKYERRSQRPERWKRVRVYNPVTN